MYICSLIFAIMMVTDAVQLLKWQSPENFGSQIKLTCFERAWYSAYKDCFTWVQWHGSIQHKVSIWESPRSDLNRFIFYCRWGDTQVQLVIVLYAGINQLLHRALILKAISRSKLNGLSPGKILGSGFQTKNWKIENLHPFSSTVRTVQITQTFKTIQFNCSFDIVMCITDL